MKIYLIRHGQTTGDVEDRYGGDYDDHMTDEGKMQAKKLANRLADKNIEILFYSPLVRAKETALAIQEKIGCQLEVMDGMKERNFYGILTGMVKQEAMKTYPELVALLPNDQNTINGAESYEHFRERLFASFDEITSKPNDVIGVVTHGGPMLVLFRELLGKEIKKVEDCGFVVLEKSNKEISLLESDGVTFK